MTEEIKPNKKAKYTLIAILVISIAPIALAYLMYFTGWGVPQNTVNKGEFFDAISTETLVSDDVWTAMQADKKWRLFLPLGEACNELCAQNFYTTRQVHIRLGEKGTRVERYALNYGGETGSAYLDSLKESHPLLKRADVDPEIWQRWSQSLERYIQDRDSHFYMLVDQEGYAMMAFTDQHGNELLKDLKHVLKHTIDYQK